MNTETINIPSDSPDEVLPDAALLSVGLIATADMPRLSAAEPQQFELLTRLASLEEALLAKDPMMPTHLAAIHRSLVTHEELVHLLTDDQIGAIVNAQQSHTNTFLAAEVTTKTGSNKAAGRAAKLTLSDL